MHFCGSRGRGFRTLPVAPLSSGAPLPHTLHPAGPRAPRSEPDPLPGEGLRLLPLDRPSHSPALPLLCRMGRSPLAAPPNSNSPPAPTADSDSFIPRHGSATRSDCRARHFVSDGRGVEKLFIQLSEPDSGPRGPLEVQGSCGTVACDQPPISSADLRS
ncbi:hypothetical protein NDU88_000636 [Pleurodeles waltl]|uniref:Uncharacterized protein n=1 Tax=Pleurodeles waltl TaxID=8319 RepID=A0AAV7VXH9_PLEWA|nr:hypothetical protein NDU88_000636 [Pleurodeles waltl]